MNAILLTIAVVMIGWTVVWMKANVQDMTHNLRNLGQQTARGEAPVYAIAVIVATALLREGAEVILFTYGVVTATDLQLNHLLGGLVIGLVSGGTMGGLTYWGLCNLSRKYIFQVTTVMLILLAAGIAAQIPNYLSSIMDFNRLSEPLWDSSWLLSDKTILGNIMHVFTGYTAKPSIVQLIFYFTSLAFIIGWKKWSERVSQ
jgi:high-affinity iron transporter